MLQAVVVGGLLYIKDETDNIYNLHALKGPLKNFWSVSVSGNWRVIFRFEDGYVLDVDYLDYY